MKQKYYLKLVGLMTALLLVVAVMPASAATKPTAKSTGGSEDITQAVTQSYNADASVQMGMMVKLKDKDPNSVEPLTADSVRSLLGVIVAPNDATVTLTPQNANQQQVYVATAGRYDVLVSNQNGVIHSGDLITISSVAGVGMRAGEDQSVVLGKAAGSFNGTSNVVGTLSVKDTQGKSHQVSLARIAVNLDIASNPLQSKATDYVPSFLAKAATTVSGRPVSAARIYLGIITLFAAALVTGNIMYSGVRSGMTAIGRNPLSRKSIIRSLIQTVIAGLIIFVVGVFAVYLLLKL